MTTSTGCRVHTKALLSTGLLALSFWCAPVTVSGCSAEQEDRPPHTPQIKTIDISYADLESQKFITRDVTLQVGDTLQLTLASNAATGFSWTAQTQIDDPAVIEQTSHESIAPTAPLPGAAGTETWTFKAVKEGSTSVRTDYGQPWPGGTTAAWTFTGNINVQ